MPEISPGRLCAACLLSLAFCGSHIALAQGVPAPAILYRAAMQDETAAAASTGSLAVTAAWLRQTPDGAKVGAGYLSIENHGDHADRLTGVESPAAGLVEIHSMSMDNGIMRMRPVPDGLEIPPHGRVELKPGGYHLMLEDLKNPLKAGERVKLRLKFEKAAAVEIDAPVANQPPSAAIGAMETPMKMPMH